KIIKKVVFNLKGHPGKGAEFHHFFRHMLISIIRKYTYFTACRYKCSRFLANYFIIDILGDIQLTGFLQLKKFTFTHFADSSGNNGKKIKIFVIRGKKYRLGKKIITHKHSDLIFPEGIYGEKVSAFKAFVHHIVVYECCS